MTGTWERTSISKLAAIEFYTRQSHDATLMQPLDISMFACTKGSRD